MNATWLALIQLGVSFIQQALVAFATGQKKEAPMSVALSPEHKETLIEVAKQSGVA